MSMKALILSIIIAILSILTKNIYPIIVTGDYNSFNFEWYDLILIILLVYIIYQFIVYIIYKKITLFKADNKLKRIDKYITPRNIILFVILINVISFFINFTDKIMITTQGIWYRAINDTISNHDPVINTLFLSPGIWLYKLTDNAFLGIQLNRIVLYLFNIVVYSLLNCYVWKKSKNVKYLLFSLFWTLLLPINFQFNSFVWKDIYFTNFIIIFTILLYEIIDTKFEVLKKIWFNILFILIAIIASLIKGNAFIPFILLFIVSIIFYKKGSKRFIISLLIVVLCYFGLTQKVLPHFYKTESHKVESAGIEISFMSRLVKEDFELDNQDKRFMDDLIPAITVKENYNPNCIDSIKFSIYFNASYFSENYNQFKDIAHKYMKRYPTEFIKTYLISTYEFWSLYTPDYTAGYVWYIITKTPILNLITCPIIYLILFILLGLKYKNNGFWLLFIIPFGIFLTIYYCVPINISIRYIHIIFPNLVLFLLPILRENKKD